MSTPFFRGHATRGLSSLPRHAPSGRRTLSGRNEVEERASACAGTAGACQEGREEKAAGAARQDGQIRSRLDRTGAEERRRGGPLSRDAGVRSGTRSFGSSGKALIADRGIDRDGGMGPHALQLRPAQERRGGASCFNLYA